MSDELRLEPAQVTAQVGIVEFTFVNAGVTPHDISLGSVAPTAAVPPGTGNVNSGQRQTVRVQIPAPGTYPYPCLYHGSTGMIGTLFVR